MCLALITCSVFASGLRVTPSDTLHASDLPRELWELGISTFGSQDDLVQFLGDSQKLKSVTVNGIPVLLFAGTDSGTVPWIETEMQSDPYGIGDISQKSATILDIGSNIGDMSITASKIHPGAQIIAIEPNPLVFFCLRVNMFLNGVNTLLEEELGKEGKSGVLALNKAVTVDGRNVTIQWNTDLTQASNLYGFELHKAWHTKHPDRRAAVASLNIDRYMREHQHFPVALAKMDCEGCEYEVIPQQTQFFLKSVDRFVGEVHTYFSKSFAEAEVHALEAILASPQCQVETDNTFGGNFKQFRCKKT